MDPLPYCWMFCSVGESRYDAGATERDGRISDGMLETTIYACINPHPERRLLPGSPCNRIAV